MKTITRGLIGLEDIATGTGTFQRTTSVGGTQTLTQIRLGATFGTTTVKTSGTTFVTGSSTNTIWVRLQGGGGGGGGTNATVSGTSVSPGAGGGAGGYAEKTFAVTPITTYTIAIGTGGAGGAASGQNGAAGGNTTLAVGATTVTAFGGGGGTGASAFTVSNDTLGGAGGVLATNGDLNSGGSPGSFGLAISPSGNTAVSGSGGSAQMGAGAAARDSAGGGANGIGFGGGGGGGLSRGTVAGNTGGNGSPGAIIITEYS